MLRTAAEYLRLVSGQVIAECALSFPQGTALPVPRDKKGVNPRDLYSDGNLEKE